MFKLEAIILFLIFLFPFLFSDSYHYFASLITVQSFRRKLNFKLSFFLSGITGERVHLFNPSDCDMENDPFSMHSKELKGNATRLCDSQIDLLTIVNRLNKLFTMQNTLVNVLRIQTNKSFYPIQRIRM